MTLRLCKSCGDWHDLDKPWPHNCLPEMIYRRSHLSGPMLIRDEMAPVQSMLDGKLYDSKRNLRSTYKAAGVVEVGNDPAMFKKPEKKRPDRNAIKASVRRAFSRAGFGA